MKKNVDAFQNLLESTYEVELVSNSKISLACRRIPFTTVAYILQEAATRLQSEVINVLEELGRNINAERTSPSKENSVEFGMRIVKDLVPSLVEVVTTSTALLNRVLLDVIVDAQEENIKHLAMEDALVVLTTAVGKMDKAVIAKQVTELFFALTAVAKVTQDLRVASTLVDTENQTS